MFVIWGGKSAVLWSKLSLYGDAPPEPWNVICDRKTADLPPQITNLNAVIPILMHFFILFSVEKMNYLHKATSAVSCVKPNECQWEATLRDDVGFQTVYCRIHCRKFWRYPIRRRVTYASALNFLLYFMHVCKRSTTKNFFFFLFFFFFFFFFFCFVVNTSCLPDNNPSKLF